MEKKKSHISNCISKAGMFKFSDEDMGKADRG
jgi:hypothetical protein